MTMGWVKVSMIYPCVCWVSSGLTFFCAKLLRPWATSSAAALSVCVRDREPPQPSARNRAFGFKFSHTSKIWVSRSCRRLHTCLMHPHGRSCRLHEKRPALPKKLKRASQKGKRIKPQKLRNYESKTNDNRRGQASRHQPLSELPQDRERARYEEALLRAELPFSALWRLYL